MHAAHPRAYGEIVRATLCEFRRPRERTERGPPVTRDPEPDHTRIAPNSPRDAGSEESARTSSICKASDSQRPGCQCHGQPPAVDAASPRNSARCSATRREQRPPIPVGGPAQGVPHAGVKSLAVFVECAMCCADLPIKTRSKENCCAKLLLVNHLEQPARRDVPGPSNVPRVASSAAMARHLGSRSPPHC